MRSTITRALPPITVGYEVRAAPADYASTDYTADGERAEAHDAVNAFVAIERA